MVVILYLFVSGKLPLSLPFLVTWDGGFLNTYHLFSSGPPSDSQINLSQLSSIDSTCAQWGMSNP